jgi:hypothetical protein
MPRVLSIEISNRLGDALKSNLLDWYHKIMFGSKSSVFWLS